MRNAEPFTFTLGGVHPPGRKALTAGLPLEVMPPQSRYVVSMAQHFGAPAVPLVKKGDAVREGLRIGGVDKFLGAEVHSPVTGTVVSVGRAPHPILGPVPAVVIERDPEAPDAAVTPLEWESLQACDILARIRDAGVVGMGGAGFPTHVKLCPPANLTIDTCILNGVECESYLTADHRLMLERPADIVQGLRILLKTLGAERAFIGIENNKPDAVEALRAAVAAAGEGKRVTVAALDVKYPQGSEKQLIEALTGRRVPAGGLPAHVGCVVQNVATANAVYEAVALGRSCYERVVTVSGRGVARQANLVCRVGVTLADLAAHLGGLREEAVKCVLGGPMMGFAVAGLDYPVTKTTSGVLFLTTEESPEFEHGPCIRCGRCLDACPMGLMPNEMSIYAERRKYDGMPRFGLWECFECGSCSYVCPAKRPLVQFIRAGKARLKSGAGK
ncbi:MAG: electron transport complex subunit RsxC [Desulfovibrionaceae bacterium]|uniref:electron transport complex subunit RsxC n=1 Tax=Desulfovibrio aminophilus TaxID=81425 RepID=UPI00041C0EEC|nr:electron transport complex subunit RsxC [Desulfovibrio aminophilus]MDY0304938.1 electron transport complex subunit RsxC [Desulfovibrionaceae bacterium]